MAKSLTGANSVILLSIPPLYAIAQQLQRFAADDVTDIDPVKPAEILTGVDAKMSAGWVYVPVIQKITLQADSDSNSIFENWYASNEAAQDIYFAQGILRLPAVQRSYVLTNGVLTSHKPSPDVKKLLQPRVYEITWESVVAAPI